jgi:glycerate kinase
LLNARITSGIEFIMERLDFEHQVKHADLVVTGEGQLDKQSMNGKVVSGVADLCSKYKKPLWIICGKNNFDHKPFDAEKIISLSELAGAGVDTFRNASSLITKFIHAAVK